MSLYLALCISPAVITEGYWRTPKAAEGHRRSISATSYIVVKQPKDGEEVSVTEG